jgi:2-aminobenzoate-CoA ligase
MKYTGHTDTFAKDSMPPEHQLPEFVFSEKALNFDEKINCAAELIDKKVAQGHGDKIAIRSPAVSWTYRELLEKSNQIANFLTAELGLEPGNRVLLRGPNTPMIAASWLGVIKAGGIVVATMPLLRSHELEIIIGSANIQFALCDNRLAEELYLAQKNTSQGMHIAVFQGSAAAPEIADFELLLNSQSKEFCNVETAADDVALIAYTSGTTGRPKGAMHFHREVMAMCICVGENLIRANTDDVFIGSPPLAFTFGLGMQLAIPLHAGATTVLIESPTPKNLAEAIGKYRVTICSTAPTAYRAMLDTETDNDFSSLKKAVSAGEQLPSSVYKAWHKLTGIKLIDGLGATEMIHIFVSASEAEIQEGSIGKALYGYEIRILDNDYQTVQCGELGLLAVKGPTGCKYLNDNRQQEYVVDGWNITGDTGELDENGYFKFCARSDDMIVSAGYNISPSEVEYAVMKYADVAECAVVGIADEKRGQLVKAYVVLKDECDTERELLQESLKEFVKATIAPYKYPRAIEFVLALPRTSTGKIQRFLLRD